MTRRWLETGAGAAKAVMGAALAVCGAVGVMALAAPAAPQVGRGEAAYVVTDSGAGHRRPFEHQRHERLECSSCHGTGSDHREIKIRTARDCASCHHDPAGPARNKGCRDCHAEGQLDAVTSASVSLRLTVWREARSRTLPFRHARHLAPANGLQCRDCHRTPVTMEMNRECGSCHAPHHRQEAQCSSCHVVPATAPHTDGVHLSCNGSGCHATSVALPSAQSRTLCLACHWSRVQHEPGRICGDCHRIPLAATPAIPASAP